MNEATIEETGPLIVMLDSSWDKDPISTCAFLSSTGTGAGGSECDTTAESESPLAGSSSGQSRTQQTLMNHRHRWILAMVGVAIVAVTMLFSAPSQQAVWTGSFTNGSSKLPHCARSYKYGQFQEGEPLGRGQFIQRNTNDNITKLTRTEGIFVDEDNKFAFCTIQKNGCSTWTAYLHRIMHDNYNNHAPQFGVPGQSIEALQARHNVTDPKDQTAMDAFLLDPTTTVAVFVRDPLARLVSGYRNKCFDSNCSNGFCSSRAYHGIPQGQQVTFRQHVDWFLSKDPRHTDGHWQLQSEHCGLDGNKTGNAILTKYYNFVALMTAETLAQDAECLTEIAHVDRYNVHNDTDRSHPFWVHDPIPKDQYEHSNSEEEEYLKKYYTQDMVEHVMEHMRQDYQVFQIPRPSWVEQATGDWADATGVRECQ